MKFISPDDFNKLSLPSEVSDKVIEACRCIFILGMPLNSAALLCGVNHPQGMTDLADVIKLITAQLSD